MFSKIARHWLNLGIPHECPLLRNNDLVSTLQCLCEIIFLLRFIDPPEIMHMVLNNQIYLTIYKQKKQIKRLLLRNRTPDANSVFISKYLKNYNINQNN